MRNTLVFLATLIFPVLCFAGIETLLVEEQQGDCTVRVVHDATPSSNIGTIVFRSFIIIENLYYSCEPTKSQVAESLSKGIAKYLSHEELKLATSIMVGKIGGFPWVKLDWQSKSQSGTYENISIGEFNAIVSSAVISQPFVTALNLNGLEFDGASCEKMQFYENGYPMDALCWLKIKSALQ